jgi:ABC-2 type transport system ATP-binding protein
VALDVAKTTPIASKRRSRRYDAAMDQSPSIQVRHLRKVYGEIVAVDDLTFSAPRGAVLGLLGGNGAGKTTTIAMLLGLLEPTAGEISVLGVDMLKRRYAALPRMNFSSPYVDLPHRLTVRQNLLFYGRLYGVKNLARRIEEIAEHMQIGPFLDRRSGKLSAGQKTRVALAKALINRPEVLLLDEPTASLDPDTADWVRGYLKDYQHETHATIMLASHNMSEVERLCDDVILLQAGRVFERGSPRELIERFGREDMEEVFLDMARGRGRGLDALNKKEAAS